MTKRGGLQCKPEGPYSRAMSPRFCRPARPQGAFSKDRPLRTGQRRRPVRCSGPRRGDPEQLPMLWSGHDTARSDHYDDDNAGNPPPHQPKSTPGAQLPLQDRFFSRRVFRRRHAPCPADDASSAGLWEMDRGLASIESRGQYIIVAIAATLGGMGGLHWVPRQVTADRVLA